MDVNCFYLELDGSRANEEQWVAVPDVNVHGVEGQVAQEPLLLSWPQKTLIDSELHLQAWRPWAKKKKRAKKCASFQQQWITVWHHNTIQALVFISLCFLQVLQSPTLSQRCYHYTVGCLADNFAQALCTCIRAMQEAPHLKRLNNYKWSKILQCTFSLALFKTCEINSDMSWRFSNLKWTWCGGN